MIRTKQAGNSQNPTASVDANEEVIDEALRGKQGHLPLAPMIKITWETTFRDISVNQSTITYDDDHGVDLSAHWLLEYQIMSERGTVTERRKTHQGKFVLHNTYTELAQ